MIKKMKEKLDYISSVLAMILTVFVVITIIIAGILVLIPFFVIGVIVIGFKKFKRLIHRSYKLMK